MVLARRAQVLRRAVRHLALSALRTRLPPGVCTQTMPRLLFTLALAGTHTAGTHAALPAREGPVYNAQVTSDNDWAGFQVVALHVSSAADLDGVLSRANPTDVWRVQPLARLSF